MKSALVTGAAGQDGFYLSQLLLDKGYEVHALVRKASVPSQRLDTYVRKFPGRFHVHSGDLLDAGFIHRVLDRARPCEVYNLAAMSDVAASFEAPDYTLQVNLLGATRLLEALRGGGYIERNLVRFYQASTSEVYGDSSVAQDENTKMNPVSPYAAAKLAAFWMTRIYRDAYGMHASNGILFNHESPKRADCFVTKKIAMYVAKWFSAGGGIAPLTLGNLESKRDWSHARDMVRGMWMIAQHETPGDYVLASGTARSVREFLEAAFSVVGLTIVWDQDGRRGCINGQVAVLGGVADHIRPLDVPVLMGDALKARRVLGWAPLITFQGLVQEMVEAELAERD